MMGADITNAEPMRIAYLTLSFDSAEEAEEKYASLIEGGEIFMEIKKIKFAERFTMLRDRFGASWMLLCQK
jgi:PhnB protein